MRSRSWILGAGLSIAFTLAAQDRISVPFRDPSRPGSISVNTLNGRVTVKAYDGREVVIETSGSVNGPSNNRNPRGVPDGMHRIDSPTRGINVEEDNNTVRINGGPMAQSNLTIQVPVQTSVKLKSLNGALTVEGVAGELDLDTFNGRISVTDASGSILAHTVNGRIEASLAKLPADNKMLSFSTMNAPIDLTLPPDAKAKLRMRSDQGEIFTDFDVKLELSSTGTIVDNRRNGSRYRVRPDRTLQGTVNGGGTEIQVTTYNGRITIGKKK